MTLEEANYLSPGTRLRVLRGGMERHRLEPAESEGIYVSQLESPVHGRLVVVNFTDQGAYGFRLDELEIVGVAGGPAAASGGNGATPDEEPEATAD